MEHMTAGRKLLSELIGLARATDGSEHLISEASTVLTVECLAALTAPNGELGKLLDRVAAQKRQMVPDCFSCACPCGRTAPCDMDWLDSQPEPIRKQKERILNALGAAAAAGIRGAKADRLYYTGLIAVGMDGFSPEELSPIAGETEALIKNL